MSNGLVVIADKVLGPLVAGELRRGLSKRAFIVELVYSEEEAKARLSTTISYDLVVVHIDIPAGSNDPGLTDGFRGFSLLKWLAEKKPQTPAILMVQAVDRSITFGVSTLPRKPRLVSEGLNLARDLLQAAEDSLVDKKDTPDEYLDLTITVNDAENEWAWQLAGAYSSFGVLEIDKEELETLSSKSKILYDLMSTGASSSDQDQEPIWLQFLGTLGIDILRGIFRRNVAFWGHFCAGLARVEEDYERINICFRTSSRIHDIALEAISSKEVANQFWMLRAPIYRWIGGVSNIRRPLFSSPASRADSKINCLIIEANAWGKTTFSNGLTMEFPKLTRAEYECDQIEQYLAENKDAFEIGRILRVSRRILGGETFENFLIKTLRQDTWDLIHYVGHSFFHERQGKGYILLPNPIESGGPIPVPIEEFGTQLRQARFLYLSSCQSAQRSFLISLAKCKVPALLGFSCPVFDEHAEEFALEFYKQLFGGPQDSPSAPKYEEDQKCLQRAFLRTRKLFHRKMPAETIWAQPILVLQSD